MAIVGLLVIVAWYAHWSAIIQVMPNYPSMKFNTALAIYKAMPGTKFSRG